MTLDSQHPHAADLNTAAPAAEPEADTSQPTAKTYAQIVWDAIVDLANEERHVTRKVLCEVTGLKAKIVDDHVERLILHNRLRRLGYGVLEVVEQFPETRAVSKTVLPGGLIKLEIGDECMDLTPSEALAVGQLFCGEVLAASGMAAGSQALVRINELSQQLKTAGKR